MRVVKDRRSSLRVAISGEVFVYTERDRLEGECVDLGMGGMRVHSAWPTYSKRLLTIEAFVAGERLRLDAELLRHEETSEGHALVFRFVDTTPDTRRALERIIMQRLAESTQRDYAQAFEEGALGGVPTGGAGPGDDGGAPVPVISGATQAIAVDAPVAGREHTMIAPAPSPERTMRVDASRTAVVFDASWDEEEGDTARFLRITDDVGPGHTVRMDREGRPLPPEHTVMIPAAELREARGEEPEAPLVPARPWAEVEPPAARVDDGPPDGALEPRTERMRGGPPSSEEPTTERMRGGSPSDRYRLDRTVIVAQAELEGAEAVEAPAPVEVPQVEAPQVEAPRTEAPRTEAPGAVVSGSFVGAPPSPEPPDLEPVAPPLLRGGAAPRSPESGGEVQAAVELRPSQRALLDAKALLRGRSSADSARRRPRVIVTIPHRTYRRRGRIRGLR